MSEIVGDLLELGIPVILITGRGRTSTRKAAAEIKRHSGLSDWYLRRLQCITHNGVFFLQTPTEDPSQFLSRETFIETNEFDVDALLKTVGYSDQGGRVGIEHRGYDKRAEIHQAHFGGKGTTRF
jgi:hypothetical protein